MDIARTDPRYSDTLLRTASRVFEFADTYRVAYIDNTNVRDCVCPFYCDFDGYQAAVKCSASIESTSVDASRLSPSIRSGSHTDIGGRKSNEDQHICINDVTKHLGDDVYKWAHLPILALDGAVDDLFLKELQDSHCKAFLKADQALKNECSISDYCGTIALIVLILGRHVIIENAGDCRAVISRKGKAIQMSNDHRPSYLQEKKRVEELGGYFEDGYLNGELAVTRALGDRHMKSLVGSNSKSPLTAELEMTQMVLTNDDEFLIIGCDGIQVAIRVGFGLAG
ncbi:probable protein phosphatase 2C 49 [Tanacetum coccineum]